MEVLLGGLWGAGSPLDRPFQAGANADTQIPRDRQLTRAGHLAIYHNSPVLLRKGKSVMFCDEGYLLFPVYRSAEENALHDNVRGPSSLLQQPGVLRGIPSAFQDKPSLAAARHSEVGDLGASYSEGPCQEQRNA